LSRTAVELVASCCEVWGALLMANALLGLIGPWQVPKYLLSAVLGGKLGRGAGRLGGLTPENHAASLRGLGFVLIGFLLELGVALVDLARTLAR
jgi:hypothetical protein